VFCVIHGCAAKWGTRARACAHARMRKCSIVHAQLYATLCGSSGIERNKRLRGHAVQQSTVQGHLPHRAGGVLLSAMPQRPHGMQHGRMPPSHHAAPPCPYGTHSSRRWHQQAAQHAHLHAARPAGRPCKAPTHPAGTAPQPPSHLPPRTGTPAHPQQHWSLRMCTAPACIPEHTPTCGI